MMNVRASTLVLPLAVMMLLTSCDHPLQPGAQHETVLIDVGTIRRIDLQTGRIVAQSDAAPAIHDAFAFTPDSSVLLVSGFGEAGSTESAIVAIDASTLRVRWMLPIGNSPAARDSFPGYLIQGNYSLAVSGDGRYLAIADVFGGSGSSPGVGILDLSTRHLTGFVGPLLTASILSLPHTADDWAGPNGLLVIGTRPSGSAPAYGGSTAYVIDASTAQIRDSIALDPHGVSDAVIDADGRTLFAVSASREALERFDLERRERTAWATVPSGAGKLTLSGSGSDVWVSSYHDIHEVPGSGFVYHFDRDLQQIGAVDFRPALPDGNGVPPTLGGPLINPNSGDVVVPTGTPDWGPLYGPQPSGILIASPTAGYRRRLPVDGGVPRLLRIEPPFR